MTKRMLGMLFLFIASCADDEQRTGYTIEVAVTGSPDAWRNVSAVSVEGEPVEVPLVLSAEATSTTFLCTADKSRFLESEHVSFVVTLEDGTEQESIIDRYACRYSEVEGTFEYLHVRLLETGEIDGDFTQPSSSVYTACTAASAWLCPADQI